mmetsp:Transcript_27594/g.40584  ORF Transcript_27594/g.40584 Transcript_27594/m.40584 type:complete len:201 (+) Transcript_27594:1011-1613(+)
MGNLHVIARPLRQALYSRLASVTVVEIFPVWNSDLNDVVFEETKVDPDKSLDHLLDDPTAALKWLTTNDIALPPSIGEARHSQEWRSYARSMIVAELCFTAHIAASPNSRNLIDSVSIAKSIDPYYKKSADFLPSIANPWPRGVPDYFTYKTCYRCDRSSNLSLSELEYFWQKEFTLPNLCPKCRYERKKAKETGETFTY